MNKITLIGRLPADPELRTVNGQNGSFITMSVDLAVQRPYGRKDQNGHYPSDFFHLVTNGKTAENFARLKKGQRVAVEGYLYNDTFKDRNGQNRTITKVRVNSVEFIDYPEQTQNSASSGQASANPMSSTQASAYSMPSGQPSAYSMPSGQASAYPMSSTQPMGAAPDGMPAGQGMPYSMPEDLPFN